MLAAIPARNDSAMRRKIQSSAPSRYRSGTATFCPQASLTHFTEIQEYSNPTRTVLPKLAQDTYAAQVRNGARPFSGGMPRNCRRNNTGSTKAPVAKEITELTILL